MAKQQNKHRYHRPNPQQAPVKTPLDEARDELFQHIMRCGVIGSAPEHQAEWFDDTMKYLTDRYPELKESDMSDLRVLGERFAQPPKAKQAV